jgi:hypothetical protein
LPDTREQVMDRSMAGRLHKGLRERLLAEVAYHSRIWPVAPGS